MSFTRLLLPAALLVLALPSPAQAKVSDDMGGLLFTLFDVGLRCGQVADIAQNLHGYECSLEGTQNTFTGALCVRVLDANCLRDTDGDGLDDDTEVELGTDPDVADTDGDDYDDGAEVDGNTDPLDADDYPYAGGWDIGACRDDLVSTGNAVGDIVEDFELLDQNGETVRLHDFCDRAILIDSGAMW